MIDCYSLYNVQFLNKYTSYFVVFLILTLSPIQTMYKVDKMYIQFTT